MSRTSSFIINAFILLSSCVLLSKPATGSEALRLSAVMTGPDGLRYQVLRYSDLNLATQAGSEALYQRITRSAGLVCQATPVTRPVFRADVERCRQNAVALAVAAIGADGLNAVHATHAARRAQRG